MNDDSHARTWRSGEHTTHLTVRVAGAVLLAVLTGVVTRWGLAPLVTDSGFIGSMFALLAACGVGTLLTRRAIAPVTRSRDELEVAYQEAVAEALQDPLTKLGNHRAFQEELDRQVEASLRYQTPAALVLIDLDGFKAVNDTHGHHVGDLLLVEVADRLRSCVAPGDTVARLGGDEFAVLLVGSGAEAGELCARRISRALERPVALDGVEIDVEASIGIATATAGETLDALTQHADAAMYASKRDRIGHVRHQTEDESRAWAPADTAVTAAAASSQ